MQQRYGIPLSSSTLYTDSIVIAAASLFFGWELALYATVTRFIGASLYIFQRLKEPPLGTGGTDFMR